MTDRSSTPFAKPPLQWTGVLFALAANLMLVTLVEVLSHQLGLGNWAWLLAGIAAPLLAGLLTARYTGQRGAIHAFLGGLISIPIIGLLILPDAWQFALFAGAYCTLGGAVTELATRRRT